MRALLLTLCAALAASSCGAFLTDTNELNRVDVRWSADGLHVAVKRDYYDPGQAQGGGESVGGGVTTQLSDWLVGDAPAVRTVRTSKAPVLEEWPHATMREGDHNLRVLAANGSFRAYRDEVEVAEADVLLAELGRPEDVPVSAFTVRPDATVEIWSASSDTGPLTARKLGALPGATGSYGRLLVARGPTLGVAAWDRDRNNSYGDGQVAVFSEGTTGRVLGAGAPIAVWTSGSSAKAIVERGHQLGTAPGTYSVIDGTSSQPLAAVLDEATRPQNKSDPCGAATFSSDGTPLLAREERTQFRVTDGATSFTVSRPSGEYVQQCFLLPEDSGARVHLVFTTSPGLAVQKPLTLHEVVLEGGKVIARHEVDLTPDAIH